MSEEDFIQDSLKESQTEYTFPMTQEQFSAATYRYEKKIYDLQQMLEISSSLCTNLELSSLIQSILYVTMAQMRVLGAGIFIADTLDAEKFSLNSNYSGLEINPVVDYSLPLDGALLAKMEQSGKVWTREELLKEFPSDKDVLVLDSLHPSLVIPLIQKHHINGVLVLGERISLGDDDVFTKEDKDYVYTLASLAAIAVNNASLVEQSSTDMMTKLKLKYYFFNMLTDKLDSAKAHDKKVSVIMFDIDFFKKFNDTYGHACGDYVLINVAKLIKEGVRTKDIACRYGGEEFVIMLENTGKRDAMRIANRIRKSIEKNVFFYEDHHMNVTISGGVSTFCAEKNNVMSPKLLVDQADQALYKSKRNGRNQVTFAEPGELSDGGLMS